MEETKTVTTKKVVKMKNGKKKTVVEKKVVKVRADHWERGGRLVALAGRDNLSRSVHRANVSRG